MGKKSRLKKERRQVKTPAPQTAPTLVIEGAGDLRLIEQHVKHFVAGVPQADIALRMLGRDAALVVARLGEELNDDRVRDLGQKLVAVPPKQPTNLYALREESVAAHLARAKTSAPLASDQPTFPKQTASVGLFDPARVADALVRSGRPRFSAERLGAGDLAVFPVDTESTVRLCLGPPPAGQATLDLRLAVDSGVVFVGPADACDGPRLGTVRLDPFTTQLDACLARGGFCRVPPGRYRAQAFRVSDADVVIHLTAGEDIPVDPIAPASIGPLPAR